MTYIRMFKDISKKDVGQFGGKVASLGEMFQSNTPVPNGFGISIEAQKKFVSNHFSPQFEHELKTAFDRLSQDRVAVRSSAIAEDSSNASWAGQLETYLNVRRENLEEAIRKCWKSIEADRVKAYAKDKNISKDSLFVGVGVQVMVESDAAGVMFTANPVTGNKDEVMIEAAYGLGETVVQGIVTPDNYIVDKKNMRVSNFSIQIKDKMMIFKDNKNLIIKVPESIEDRAVLKEEMVIELANLGVKVEQHYKSPQDIEWALKDGAFFILQARPITSLNHLPNR